MRLSQVLIGRDNNSDGLGVGATKLFRIPVENNTLTGKTSQETKQYMGTRKGQPPTDGTRSVEGSLEVPISADNAPFFMYHVLGKQVSKAAASTNTWTAATAVVAGEIVNHSNTLHSLYCRTGGTTGGTEPDLSAYTTAQMGRDLTIVDNGVVWVIYPKLWKYVFTEGECLPPFLVENKIADACSGAAAIYERFGGLRPQSIPIGFTGDDITVLNASIPVMGADYASSDEVGFQDIATIKTLTPIDLVAENFSKQDLTITFNGATTTSIEAIDLSMTVDNGVTKTNTLGTNTARVSTGALQVTGTSNIYVTPSLFAEMRQKTIQNVVAEMKIKGKPFELKIEFPKVTPIIDSLVHSITEDTKMMLNLTAHGDITVRATVISSTDL